jgi:hypothetical protein
VQRQPVESAADTRHSGPPERADPGATPRETGWPSHDDFSLVLGGPLFQLARRAHLTGDALELCRRRIVAGALLAWLPLLILSALDGRAWGSAVPVPFLLDVEAHVRFLVALPLLIVAELVVHQRMRPLARQFLERGLVPDSSRARFDAAVASAIRLRNSVAVEVALVAFVYGVLAVYAWPRYAAMVVPTWSATPAAGGRDLSAAGWWFACVSLPLFHFMLLRWYFRLFLWVRVLWQVSRCDLRLVPTHPDRAAGLGFLSALPMAFAPLLAAHGAIAAGYIAGRIFFEGATLLQFKVEVAVVLAFLLVVVLGPLLIFTPRLAATRRVGLREYGVLAQRYVREFDDKWLRGGAPAGEPLVGSADIQSLADLGNTFEIVRGIRPVPFSRDAVLQLAAITLIPVAPLLLTMISLEELVKRLLQIVL